MIEDLDDIDEYVRREMIQAACKAAPLEMCGVLIHDDKYQAYYPEYPFIECRNCALNPSETFEISADEWLACTNIGEICAVVHSHPEGSPFLSGADRVAQLRTGLPWLLVADGQIRVFEPVPPLMGRVFEYGRFDCYELVRDAYHLCGFGLPEITRQTMEQDAQDERFIYELTAYGFFRVMFDELTSGDLIITAFDGKPSHVCLYLGGGEMLHHAYGQLSRCEIYSDWWQSITHSIWRHADFDETAIVAVFNDLKANHDNSVFAR